MAYWAIVLFPLLFLKYNENNGEGGVVFYLYPTSAEGPNPTGLPST